MGQARSILLSQFSACGTPTIIPVRVYDTFVAMVKAAAFRDFDTIWRSTGHLLLGASAATESLAAVEVILNEKDGR